MAQQGRIKSSKQIRRPAQPQQGGFGSRGRGGEQYQQKDMGAHPAYGSQVRDPNGKDEDYGNRGLHRQAGTTKVEGPEDRSAAERHGVVKDQDIHERDAIERRDPMASERDSARGEEREEDSGHNEADQSSGGGKRKKRTPAKR